MSKFENIEGDRLHTIFQQLISQQILVKVYLEQIDYENLTLITGIHDNDGQPKFAIDVPKGLDGAIAQSESQRLSFEFTSSDKVTHRFISDIDTISDKGISLFFPSCIRRHQQRDNFRVKVPSDSHAIITLDDKKVQLEIENISLGGVYCYCLNRYKPHLEKGAELSEIDLVFVFKNQCVNVPIERARILRTESRHRPKHFGLAIEFVKINRDAKKVLVKHIYELQRYFLQNRLKIVK